MLGWLPLLVLSENWVDHLLLASFIYYDSYHLDLSMVLYKALYDNHASCLSSGQD